jgi:predicted RNA-binding protein YlxR (DUF448 family)
MRTCIGCRGTAAKSELLRVVVSDGSLSPDPAARRSGRGAYLHPRANCLEIALRRKAFPRALRVPGPLDASEVTAFVAAADRSPEPSGSTAPPEPSGTSSREQVANR